MSNQQVLGIIYLEDAYRGDVRILFIFEGYLGRYQCITDDVKVCSPITILYLFSIFCFHLKRLTLGTYSSEEEKVDPPRLLQDL